MAVVGRIKQIWRYPVKSMFGELVEQELIERQGFADDRTWAVRDDASGEIVGAKKIPKLMLLKSRYNQEPSSSFDEPAETEVIITFPDGRELSTKDPDASAILSMFLGVRVSLCSRVPAANKDHYRLTKAMTPAETRYALGLKPDDSAPDFSSFSLSLLGTVAKFATPPGSYYDVYPLHFMTTSALTAMKSHYPEGDFRAERYRPSFLIETDPSITGIVENDWRGLDIRIGDALIHCNHPTIRCSMPGAAQPGMAKDPMIPKMVMQHANQHLGAYATPCSKSNRQQKIYVGDEVEVMTRRTGKLFTFWDVTTRQLKNSLLNAVANHQEKSLRKGAVLVSSEDESVPAGFKTFVLDRRFDEAGGISSFYFSDAKGENLPRYLPGQHIVLAVPAANGQKLNFRPYTISSCADDADSYRISVKHEQSIAEGEVFDGQVSTFLHREISLGDSVFIKGPMGRFAIVPSDSNPLVLVASGVGITPFVAMLDSLSLNNPNRKVSLYYGVRTTEDFAFQENLERYIDLMPSLDLTVFISKPDTSVPFESPYMRTGRMSAKDIVQVSGGNSVDYYLCGKPEFSETMSSMISESGVASENIYYESFAQSSNRADSNDKTRYKVEFTHGGNVLDWDPEQESLLSFAEHHGVNIPSGCRYGACQSCEVTLVSGSVEYSDGVDAPGGKNKILMCSCRPKSDLILEV